MAKPSIFSRDYERLMRKRRKRKKILIVSIIFILLISIILLKFNFEEVKAFIEKLTNTESVNKEIYYYGYNTLYKI